MRDEASTPIDTPEVSRCSGSPKSHPEKAIGDVRLKSLAIGIELEHLVILVIRLAREHVARLPSFRHVFERLCDQDPAIGSTRGFIENVGSDESQGVELTQDDGSARLVKAP